MSLLYLPGSMRGCGGLHLGLPKTPAIICMCWGHNGNAFSSLPWVCACDGEGMPSPAPAASLARLRVCPGGRLAAPRSSAAARVAPSSACPVERSETCRIPWLPLEEAGG